MTSRRTSKSPYEPYISRSAALDLLGIKPQTLYAYVSRGLIRSVRQPGGGKLSLYAREDVDKVKARAGARAGHGAAAASAMRWGEPIIPTAITEITADGPRYRGRSALALARSGASFEAVAELLWTGMWFDEQMRWDAAALPREIVRMQPRTVTADPAAHLLELMAIYTVQLGISRGTVAARLRAASPLDAARQMIQMLAGCIALLGPQRAFRPLRAGESIAQAVLHGLGIEPDNERTGAIQAVLVLLADHELTSSTFAARVAASAGALLHSCVAAALATNSGVEIGRLYDRVEDFVATTAQDKTMLAQARALQLQGSTPAGFNHPIYPRGDLRADHLLELARALAGRSARLKPLFEVLPTLRAKMLMHPRVELGVVAMCLALRLPRGSAGAVFTLARCAGWVAHVLEQRTAGFLLRPRARFVSAA